MTAGVMPPGWKRARNFPTVRVRDESGKSAKAHLIKCVECGRIQHHFKRGNQDSKTYFERRGWLVGNHPQHDRCEACLAFKKRKEPTTMEERKPAPNHANVTPLRVPEKAMGREERRILFRSIEEHWDDANNSYLMGWSDAKLAEAEGVPIDWVKAVREENFGGSGDDPTVEAFIAGQVEIKREMAGLSSLLSMTEKDLHSHAATLAGLDQKLDGYRNGHRRLLDRVEKLEGVAEAINKAREQLRR